MAVVEIFVVTENGDVELYGTAPGSFGYGMHVWNVLAERYGLRRPFTTEEHRAVWGLYKGAKLNRAEMLIMGSTFDAVWVARAMVPALVDALRAFQPTTPTLQAAAAVMERAIVDSPKPRGVAFNMTSVNADTWEVYEEGAEDNRPFNLDRDKHPHTTPWELGADVANRLDRR